MPPPTPTRLLALLAITLLVAPRPLPSQDPAAPEFTLRTTTRMVSLTVVVRDKTGAPVPGLRAADFTVLDEGKPQTLSAFSAAGEPESPSAGAAIAARMALPPQLPPGVFANFDTAAQAPRHAAVILLDGLSTSVSDQRFARLQILKFLSRLQSGDRVGLYALGRRLQVLHDFTSDTASLLQQLQRYQGEIAASPENPSDLARFLDDRKLNDAAPGAFQSMLDQISAEQNLNLSSLEDRIRRTMRSLESIAHHLALVPGRKSLLWVSASFPSVVSTDIRTGTGSPSSFDEITGPAARALANAGVAVYPIDARGVLVPPEYRASVTYQQANMSRLLSRTRGRGQQRQNAYTVANADPMIYNNRDETTSHHDIMAELATRTGGRAFFYENDMGKVLREALDDASATYTLAYYPAPYDDDGRFRRIRVRVNRPGVTALHREGYFALEAKPAWDRKHREAIFDVLASPLHTAAVPFAVQAAAGGPPASRRLQLALRIDPAAVTLRDEKGRFTGRLDLVLVYLDAQGESKGGAEESVNLSLSGPERDHALRSGFDYQQSLPIPDGAHRLAIAVRDAPSGRLGTFHLDLAKVGGG